MKTEYSISLADVLDEANKINKIYKDWTGTPDAMLNSIKGAAYKNYILIRCYGQIENIVRNMLADYFTSPGMPQLCIQFGNKVRERLHGSLTRKGFPEFIKKQCSEIWYNEFQRREKDSTYRCVYDTKYSFYDAGLGLTSLTNSRNDFAHGTSPYTQSIDDLILCYEKSIVWLYELDDIIKNFH